MKGTLKFDAVLRPGAVDISFIVILYVKTSMRYAQIICFFLRFDNIFLCYFFQNQASNDHLIQGNLLKWTLLNEKPNICSLHGAVTFQSIFWVILWTFIWHTIFFAVKESCHGNLVIDCWLPIKWNNVIPLLIGSSVIVIFMWFFECAMW